jgi:hypothetical protein
MTSLTTNVASLDPTATYADLLERYKDETLDVSFRDLVGSLPTSELTHGIYPYPARLLRQIPRMLLSCSQLTDGIDEVIDPFCGSGTVLLESQLAGFDSLGVEQNPVGALISRVKTTPIAQISSLGLSAALLRAAKSSRARHTVPHYLRAWYTHSALSALSRLAAEVLAVDGAVGDALRVAFLLTARRAANTDRRIPVPVRPRAGEETSHDSAFVWTEWSRQTKRLFDQIERLSASEASTLVRVADSRMRSSWLSSRKSASRLMFTSPPYGAAQKYIRSTSLELGWLGVASDRGTAHIERDSIGREHVPAGPIDFAELGEIDGRLAPLVARIGTINPKRASIYAAYFRDMNTALKNASEVCDRIVMIASTNSVAGEVIPTYEILGSIIESNGLRKTMSLRDQIRGRSLLTTRRNGHAPAAAEYVEVFQRER